MPSENLEKTIAEQARKLEAVRPINGPEGEPMTSNQMRAVRLFLEREELDGRIADGLIEGNSFAMEGVGRYLSQNPGCSDEFYQLAWLNWCGDCGIEMEESIDLTARQWLVRKGMWPGCLR